MNLIVKAWNVEAQKFTVPTGLRQKGYEPVLYIDKKDDNGEDLYTGDVVICPTVDGRAKNIRGVILLRGGRIFVRCRFDSGNKKDFGLPEKLTKIGSAFDDITWIDMLGDI